MSKRFGKTFKVLTGNAWLIYIFPLSHIKIRAKMIFI